MKTIAGIILALSPCVSAWASEAALHRDRQVVLGREAGTPSSETVTLVLSRRSWLSSAAALGGAGMINVPLPAVAESPPPIEVHEGFDLIREEMATGGVAKLAKMVENEEYEQVLAAGNERLAVQDRS